jgi:uncharacterized membrane protein YphA (DoxX/SURF4 family)
MARRSEVKKADNASPARLYALVVGAVLVMAGIVGFFYNAHFGSGNDVFGDDPSVKVFGIFTVNGWDNVLHIVTGAIGLLAAGYAARVYAFGLGLVYVVIAIWGFSIGSGDAILTIGPVNTADNVLHLILGVLGILAAAAGGGAYLAYSASKSSA